MKTAGNIASHDELDRNSEYPATGKNDKSYILNLVHFEVDVAANVEYLNTKCVFIET